MHKRILSVIVVLLIVAAAFSVAFAINSNDDKQDEPHYEELEQFIELSKVPRCCHFNEKIGAYLMDFAEKHNLPHEMDGAGNVLIDHPGSIDAKLILQGHMDMVAATEPGLEHDWHNDPLDVYIEDGMVRARGTSLGADDGAGVAIMLCALKSPELADVAFRCIITTDEDCGFIGAMALNPEWLEGYDYLVNLDNEVDGEILIGCAGGLLGDATYTPDIESSEGVCYSITISGLEGGHSALMIRNNANAILLACKYLDKLDGARIVSINGGLSNNVIPDRTVIVFTVPEGTDIEAAAKEIKTEFEKKYVEPGYEYGIEIEIDKCDVMPMESWTEKSTGDFLDMMLTCPNGMFDDFEYGIKTSSNIGIVKTADNGTCKIGFFCRALYPEDLEYYSEKIINTFENRKCEINVDSYFYGWYEGGITPLVEKAADTYKKMMKKDAVITVTHGGLECAHFQGMNPHLSQISIGPTIHYVHSTDEELELDSFHETKEFTFQIIKALAKIA